MTVKDWRGGSLRNVADHEKPEVLAMEPMSENASRVVMMKNGQGREMRP